VPPGDDSKPGDARFGFAIKMGAAFMLVASTLGRRTGFLPRWFAIVGTVAGIALLVVVTEVELAALVFPAWVAILSLLLLRASREDWAGA
jgi:hypothetical protein